jgi:hypothetical protein
MRNVDSTIHSARFDCCVFLFYSFSAVTFAAHPLQSGHDQAVGRAGRRGTRKNSMALILKRASASRPSGEWNDDGFDVLANGAVVGRIFHAAASPVGSPWM